ncbi:MAG: hypothetical protein V3U60_16670 [Gammaproteobacteria bacterium]
MAKKKKTPRKDSKFIDGFMFRDQHPQAEDHNGAVVVYGEQLLDSERKIGNPLRIIDVLHHLLRTKKITPVQCDAARVFERDFMQASLAGYRCVDLMGAQTGTIARGAPDKTLMARDRVVSAMRHLGSPGSSVAWHVIGLGESIKEFAAKSQLGNGRSLNPMEATGILRGVCGNLVGYYKMVDD